MDDVNDLYSGARSMKSVYNNRKKRTKEEIIALIIDSARSGASRTKIMNENFLNFKQTKKYIDHAIQLGFVYIDPTTKLIATPKGIEYVNQFIDMITIENRISEKRRVLTDMFNGVK